MTNLRIAFIIMAFVNVLINLVGLVVSEKQKSERFNAAIGWTCAIIWAIPE